jgi:hypothetical protein
MVILLFWVGTGILAGVVRCWSDFLVRPSGLVLANA